MMALFPLQDDEVVESLGRAESPPLRESLAEGEEFTTSLVTSLGGKQNSLGDDERLQSLEVAPTSILSGRSRESLDDRCSLEGRWNSRGDVTRHAPPGSRRSLDVVAGSLADEARSPATRSPPGSISAHGLSSCPGDAFRGTRGPCTTAILRLGTVCRGGAQGSWPPEATGAAGPPPSGPFMARPPASPSSRVRRAAITTGDRRFTACCCCCESWEEGLLLDVARGPRRSPGSSTRCCCGCDRPGRGVVSGLRRPPRRGRTHRRLTHGHRHHSRTRAQG